MTVFAFASVHGSPGVSATTMALAAAWRTSTGRDVLVIEADGDGGLLASRFETLRADRTLADVAVDVRRSFDLDAVLGSAQVVWDAVPVVVAPPSAEQTHSALTAGGDRLASGLAAADIDVLVDLGRLTTRSPGLALARRAVMTALVARPTFEDIASLSARIPELRAHGCELGLLLIGDRPYAPDEIERAVGVPVLGSVPSDPRVAQMFSGGAGNERQVRRSLLWRTYSDLASRLAARTPRAINEPASDPPAECSDRSSLQPQHDHQPARADA